MVSSNLSDLLRKWKCTCWTFCGNFCNYSRLKIFHINSCRLKIITKAVHVCCRLFVCLCLCVVGEKRRTWTHTHTHTCLQSKRKNVCENVHVCFACIRAPVSSGCSVLLCRGPLSARKAESLLSLGWLGNTGLQLLCCKSSSQRNPQSHLCSIHKHVVKNRTPTQGTCSRLLCGKTRGGWKLWWAELNTDCPGVRGSPLFAGSVSLCLHFHSNSCGRRGELLDGLFLFIWKHLQTIDSTRIRHMTMRLSQTGTGMWLQ